ncbi:hypothetical protein ACFVS9_15200 [Streptomyces sp. NPDC058008]|uniref:hypothetical protein n=1 Tax=Streptomyces sp. NPDC058008 TaxID=3346303 RepID=UPI0036F0D5DE
MIAHPQVLGESVLVITAECDRWADTDGVPARDRLDVLGLDATGRLVVVELKRGTADRDVHLQAITYAALVSRFDLDTLTQAHRDFLSRRGQTLDIGACRQRLLDHVDGEWSPALLQRPRQVIIAADFPKQVTHSVVWLSEMGIDIDLVQVGLWRVEGHIVAGFTKVYPTPEVEEFTLTPTRVEGEAAAKKLQERSRSRNAVHVLVGAGLLPDGTRLLMTPRHGVTEAIRAEIRAWVGVGQRQREVLLQQLAVRRHATALAIIELASPWTASALDEGAICRGETTKPWRSQQGGGYVGESEGATEEPGSGPRSEILPPRSVQNQLPLHDSAPAREITEPSPEDDVPAAQRYGRPPGAEMDELLAIGRRAVAMHGTATRAVLRNAIRKAELTISEDRLTELKTRLAAEQGAGTSIPTG